MDRGATLTATCLLICLSGWQLTRRIGERAAAERLLAEREMRYRALADSVTDLIMHADHAR